MERGSTGRLGRARKMVDGLQRPSVERVLRLAVVRTGAAFILFFALVAEIGPVRATVITYINPAVAAVLGVTVLDERFTAAMGIGFVLVLAGSLLATHRTSPAPVAIAEP